MKDGRVIQFKGEGGAGEGDEEYYELHANSSSQELGDCESVEELVDMLKASVVQGGDYYEEGEPIFSDKDSFIQEVEKLGSMDDIASITINGDVFGRGNQHQYEHYTYYRDIVIPRSVEKIGANAFMSCPMLNSAVVLNKETDIDGAFSDRVNIIRV